MESEVLAAVVAGDKSDCGVGRHDCGANFNLRAAAARSMQVAGMLAPLYAAYR